MKHGKCKNCSYSVCGAPSTLSDVCDGCQSDPNTGWGGYTDCSDDGVTDDEGDFGFSDDD